MTELRDIFLRWARWATGPFELIVRSERFNKYATLERYGDIRENRNILNIKSIVV